MFNNLDMLIIVSNGGCDVLVHHFETVEGFTPNCSANHLLVSSFQRALFSGN